MNAISTVLSGVSTALTAARRPTLSRRFVQAVADAGGAARVVVGSGAVTTAGWIDTDISWRAQHYLDLTRPWPTGQESVTLVYADNVIEHFDLPTARTVLRNLFDALVPGGMIRLVTPDVERTARIYLKGGDTARLHLERHARHGHTAVHACDLLRLTYVIAEHYKGYCFDYEALSHEVAAAGFVNVRRQEVGTSTEPKFIALETRADETERATTLIVEATKPTA